MNSLKFICLLITVLIVKTADIYMATDGNDNSGNGSIDKPYKSLTKCQEVANSGDKVIIRGGTYKDFQISGSDNTYNYIFQFKKSGITYQGYEDEKLFLILNLIQNIKCMITNQLKEYQHFIYQKK